MKHFYLVLSLFVTCTLFSQTEKNEQIESYTGFFNFHYDGTADKIFLEVAETDKEFLYVRSLAAGVGSNDLGLDRGKLGRTMVVKFMKAGNKLLLIQPNQRFRAITDNIEEKKSVQEAFAQSVIFGFPIVSTENGVHRIDMTKFLIRDAHGVANVLKRNKQGNYKLNTDRSALYLERTKAFPKNVEFESILTFSGEPTGSYIRSVAPNASQVTVRQHFSFIELPDDKYKMRTFDPRSGGIGISYFDYATPITSPIKKGFVIRHRLEKKDKNAALSEPVEPIIYYLDRGAPEPVRSALLEGGSWWNQAFEAAGYKDAFQFKMLPEGVDPLDVRYNVVQWVHRSTRGWSYGASVTDPRTGEIIKGHVSLGSLRIRQDYLIAQSLLGVDMVSDSENRALQMALARIRQLSAHEIGHTLGFTHNFAASYNNRSSVMDYPHPYVQLKNGSIDVSDAYDTGIGEWDKVTVKYSYQDFPETTNENEALDKIINDALNQGMKFISDTDARASGGAHINAHLWDNGMNSAAELNRVMQVRAAAIANFSTNNVADGQPLTALEDVFVPLYFFHRYQLEAAVKLIGGLDYSYAVKGDGQTIVKPISPELEAEALKALLNTIEVDALKIPERILELFPPRAYGYNRTRESFASKTGLSFDALNAPATATDFLTKFLFHPERAARMVQQKAIHKDQLGFDELLNQVIAHTFHKKHKDSYSTEIQQVINHTVLEAMLNLAANNKTTFQVKAELGVAIDNLRSWLLKEAANLDNATYFKAYVGMIDQFKKNPDSFKRIVPPKIPDGSPIGSIRCDFE